MSLFEFALAVFTFIYLAVSLFRPEAMSPTFELAARGIIIWACVWGLFLAAFALKQWIKPAVYDPLKYRPPANPDYRPPEQPLFRLESRPNWNDLP